MENLGLEEDTAQDHSKIESEPFAYAHPLGAIWRLDNYPAGMDFTKDGWFPLYRNHHAPQSNIRVREGWALVPINPSREMTKAGERWSLMPEQVWQDMIDAAPVSEVTVTMKLNKDGTMNLRSTGGFDLRKIMPVAQKSDGEE